MTRPLVLLCPPAHYRVGYAINPWMDPAAWERDAGDLSSRAWREWNGLAAALDGAGASLRLLEPAPGLPDLVFPANAAVVLDRRALLGRFRHPERRGEEAVQEAFLRRLAAQGLLDEVARIPEGLFQEGAGDCMWDAARGHFWAGWGPRSSHAAAQAVAGHFGVPAVPLELSSPHFYHLDVAFCPLPGGEILWYPPAFAASARAAVREHVPAGSLIEATDEDAHALAVNAVALGRTVLLAEHPGPLAAVLRERGYDPVTLPLATFRMGGGGAFCMTLRLDLERAAAARRVA